MKGRCLNRLTKGPSLKQDKIYYISAYLLLQYLFQNKQKKLAPKVGLEPTTDRLTADCSTTELLRNNTVSQAQILL